VDVGFSLCNFGQVLKSKNFFFDIALKKQFLFQDEASPQMAGIINLHHDIMFFLIFIGLFVFWFLFRIILKFNKKQFNLPINLTHNTFIEIF